MKKRIFGLIFLWTSMIAHPSQAAFEGFRIGGNLGLQLLQGKHYYTGFPYPSADMMKRISILGAIYGAHAGYLFELGSSKIVLGAEIYALIPTASPTINLALVNQPQEGTVSFTHNRSLGVSLIAGMMLNPKIMAYLLVGIEKARFQFTYKFTNTNPAPGLGTLPAQQILNHNFNALNVGLGGTYKITPHFLLGVELSSPFFKRFKISASGPRGYNYKPAERRLMLKLSYLF